jgi:uncharacterized membrane protein YebE (DUF533 family)
MIAAEGTRSDGATLNELWREDCLRLMKFVCSFAWADSEIRPEERAFVARMAKRLGLDEDAQRRVKEWLEFPLAPDEIDPMSVPAAHRRLFIEAIEGVIAADRDVAPEEWESLNVLRQLLE